MSQWGVQKLLHGATLVPLVDSVPFCTIGPHSKISRVYVIDAHGCDYDKVNVLDAAMRGKPYSEWLALENDHEWTPEPGVISSVSGVRCIITQ